MNRINEFDLEPGPYRHHKAGVFVVMDVITHMENEQTGDMDKLEDPLVVYRELIEPVEHNQAGKVERLHRRFCMRLSDFKKDGRFSKL